MNKSTYLLVSTLALAMSAPLVHADDAPPAAPAAEAPKPDNELTFNLGATTDYRYRGISQSLFKPAIQGGSDYTNNPTGLYAGTWLSSIKWIEDSGGSNNVEWDVYGGKRGDIGGGVSYDVGVLRYFYPSNKLGAVPGHVNADTTEVYGQLTYSIFNVKYSRAETNIFAFPDSKQSGYVDLWTSIDLTEGYALGLHAGHQTIQNASQWSYTDWKVGVSKDFFDISWTLGVLGTNANKMLYVSSDGRFTGKTELVLSATKSF